jgi:hypothetical protein
MKPLCTTERQAERLRQIHYKEPVCLHKESVRLQRKSGHQTHGFSTPSLALAKTVHMRRPKADQKGRTGLSTEVANSGVRPHLAGSPAEKRPRRGQGEADDGTRGIGCHGVRNQQLS